MQRALFPVYEIILKQGECPASQKPQPGGISAFLKLNPGLNWFYKRILERYMNPFFFSPQSLNTLISNCSAKQALPVPHSNTHSCFCMKLLWCLHYGEMPSWWHKLVIQLTISLWAWTASLHTDCIPDLLQITLCMHWMHAACFRASLHGMCWCCTVKQALKPKGNTKRTMVSQPGRRPR